MIDHNDHEQDAEEAGQAVPETVDTQVVEAPAPGAKAPGTALCAHVVAATKETDATACKAEAVQGDKVCARHQSRSAEHWARKNGMAEPLLDQPMFRGKGDAQGQIRARAIPGRLNPKFDAFNQARAHHGWGPTHEMTEEEFLAALEAPKAHVFR